MKTHKEKVMGVLDKWGVDTSYKPLSRQDARKDIADEICTLTTQHPAVSEDLP